METGFDDDDAPLKLPDGFYVGLLATTIDNGIVTMVTVFSNLTDAAVTVEWNNSHIYLVTITDKDGTVFDVETLLPPPAPRQDPTVVQPRTQHTLVFPVDITKPPYAGMITFDPEKGPYLFTFKLNSPSHPWTLSGLVPVVA
ncbi:MAG TPA: hypothetical protein VEC60_09305 [Reyranella sp.]|nr:hypothetical protein [Reyranella sp.]